MEFVLIDRDDRGMSGKEGAPGLTTAQKFVALRTALGLTQVQIADAMKVDRSLISKVEHRANQLTNAHTRGALARVAGVTVDQLDRYLDGDLAIGALMSHSRVAGARVADAAERALAAAPPTAPQPRALAPTTEEASEWEDAILPALDPRRHTMADVDAVRGALRSTRALRRNGTDPVDMARALLDAAAALRAEGTPCSPLEVFARTAVTRSRAAVAAQSGDLNSSGDRQLRVLGGEPPQEPARPATLAPSPPADDAPHAGRTPRDK